jgi:phosphate transport system permease protein
MTIALDRPAPPTPPPPPAQPGVPHPRRVGRTGRDEMLPIAGSAASSFALVWLVFEQLTTLTGGVGFFICWYAVFLALYWLTTLELHTRQVATDRVVSVIVASAMLAVLVAIASTLYFVVHKGAHLVSWHLFTQDQKGIGPLSKPGTGGIGEAILGTLEQVAIAVAMAAPAGVLTAVYLNEIGGRLARAVRIVVTAMSGVPTIVAGIFIYSLWIVGLGRGFSGFAGSLALAVVILPSIARVSEEVLKTVDNGLREASTACGAPAWRTTFRVVLPAARSGVVTSILLGTARAVGETAPLLVTIFGNHVYNANPFNGPQDALPLTAYENVKLPLASAVALGFSAAFVLIVIVLVLFVLARIVSSGVSPRAWFARTVLRKAS